MCSRPASTSTPRTPTADAADDEVRDGREPAGDAGLELDAADDSDEGSLVGHPDGWYWIAPDGHQQFGPFATRELAVIDRDHISAEATDDETLQEVERASGLGEHVDIATGRPLDDETPQEQEGS